MTQPFTRSSFLDSYISKINKKIIKYTQFIEIEDKNIIRYSDNIINMNICIKHKQHYMSKLQKYQHEKIQLEKAKYSYNYELFQPTLSRLHEKIDKIKNNMKNINEIIRIEIGKTPINYPKYEYACSQLTILEQDEINYQYEMGQFIIISNK